MKAKSYESESPTSTYEQARALFLYLIRDIKTYLYNNCAKLLIKQIKSAKMAMDLFSCVVLRATCRCQ